MPDVTPLARRISRITAQEPHLLRRSPREIQSAIDEGRGNIRTLEGNPVAFLFFFVYGGWAEIGTGWVRMDDRRQGVFRDLHVQILVPIRARGLRAFGFPGSPIVEHAMQSMGCRRAPISSLPTGVLLRFAARRLTIPKLFSYLRAIRHGTHRTSMRLYVFDEEAVEAGSVARAARRRDAHAKTGAPASTASVTTSAD